MQLHRSQDRQSAGKILQGGLRNSSSLGKKESALTNQVSQEHLLKDQAAGTPPAVRLTEGDKGDHEEQCGEMNNISWME